MLAMPRSLISKLMIAAIALVLVPASLVTAYFYQRDRRTAIDQEIQRLQRFSKDSANEIDAFLFGLRDIARYGVVSAELRNFARAPSDPAARVALNGWLEQWAHVSKFIAEAYVLDLQGRCVAATNPKFVGESYSMRPYFKDAVRGLNHLSDWSVGVTSGKPGIYLSSPVLSRQGVVGGIMVVKLDPDAIDKIIRRNDAIGVQAFLVNADGILLSHYDPTLRYSVVDVLTPEATQRIGATRQFADATQITLHLKSLAEDIFSVRPGETTTSHEYVFRGQRKVAALTGTLSERWVVGIAVPFETVEASLRQQVRKMVPVLLLIVLFTAAASMYLRRFVVRPLQDLLHLAQQIGKGDYAVEAEVQGGDEVGQLARTFNEMARRIRGHTDELESKVAQRTRELEDAYEEIKALSITDGLTGCFNRRYMDQQLAREIERSRRSGRPLSIAICDVDHFKNVNDTWGHPIGDRVLQMVATVLRDNVRSGSDWIARLGGEEFLVVLPEASPEQGLAVSEKLRNDMSVLSVPVPGDSLRVTASFGLATLQNDDSPDAATLLERCDAMLYRAKRNGRNRTETDQGHLSAFLGSD